MKGQRRFDLEDKHDPIGLQPGEYGKWQEHYWYFCTPTGIHASISSKIHTITEHEDGTITVSPSILVKENHYHPSWHGYLEKGTWREC